MVPSRRREEEDSSEDDDDELDIDLIDKAALKNSVNREKEKENSLKLYVADEQKSSDKRTEEIPIQNCYYANNYWKLPSSEDNLDSDLEDLLKEYE